MRRYTISVCAGVVGACATATATGAILAFEDLTPDPPGAPYSFPLPSSFVTGGITVDVTTFFFFPSGTPAPPSGAIGAEADATPVAAGINFAGKLGNALATNNVSTKFILPPGITAIDFFLGEYGGNVNMEVNGSLYNADDFGPTLPALLGGAAISFSHLGITPGGTGGYFGHLSITGAITSFSVGGQELWIDDLTFVPTPGVGSLLLLGGLVALRRGRDKST